MRAAGRGRNPGLRCCALLLALLALLLLLLHVGVGAGPGAGARPSRRILAAARQKAAAAAAPPLGALFMCSLHERAADFALEHFRQIYGSQAVVVMVNTGVEDAPMRALARRHVVASYEQLPHVGKGGEDLVFDAPEDSLEWALRIVNRTASAFPSEVTHILLLEDDVRVLRATNLSALHHDISGANMWGPTLARAVEDFVRARNPAAPHGLVFGGFGGTILRRSFFASTMWATSELRAGVSADVLAYAALDHGKVLSSYMLLSFLVYLRNGTVSGWPGQSETWYPNHEDRMRKGEVEIEHRWEALY